MYFWIAFAVLVIVVLLLDLGVFHRHAHEVRFKEALIWSIVWIVLALVFNIAVFFWKGTQSGLEFFTGYIIEKSLSVDNIFVFLTIFRYFQVPASYQHRVLFWGILGALVMRAIFIAGGISLLNRFHWMVYVFGALLIVSGIKMAAQHGKSIHLERNPVLKAARALFRITSGYEGTRFFVRKQGILYATPLFVTLLIVELTDVVFAVDSIPAILAISRDPVIVYTSNVFAILGLRALYFALAGFMNMFAYLHYGLSVVLVFVGIKMLLSEVYKVPTGWSLAIIGLVLGLSVMVSLLKPPAQPAKEQSASHSD